MSNSRSYLFKVMSNSEDDDDEAAVGVVGGKKKKGKISVTMPMVKDWTKRFQVTLKLFFLLVYYYLFLFFSRLRNIVKSILPSGKCGINYKIALQSLKFPLVLHQKQLVVTV